MLQRVVEWFCTNAQLFRISWNNNLVLLYFAVCGFDCPWVSKKKSNNTNLHLNVVCVELHDKSFKIFDASSFLCCTDNADEEFGPDPPVVETPKKGKKRKAGKEPVEKKEKKQKKEKKKKKGKAAEEVVGTNLFV